VKPLQLGAELVVPYPEELDDPPLKDETSLWTFELPHWGHFTFVESAEILWSFEKTLEQSSH